MHNKSSALPSQLYIGLMSGTSMDGVDAALVDFSGDSPQVLGTESAPISPDLKAALMALNSAGANELHNAALAANALMRLYAHAVNALLAKTKHTPQDIRALGAHGQTVRHRPQMFDSTGYTIQLCNPSLLAELTGIDVAADFRSRDVAAGGQGAPLAPFFHRAWFARDDQTQAGTLGVLNIGGISNLTLLHTDGSTAGFDCGPGNALMDFWVAQNTGQSFDAGGAWGAGGQIIPALLAHMLSEPYFALPTPKSTGRDLFNPEWLAKHLAHFADATPQDIQKTLLDLTVTACCDCIVSYQKNSKSPLQELIVCGGGAFNTALMQRMSELLRGIKVSSSAGHGLAPQDVEAVAFAWLAKQCVERVALPLSGVTGACGARVLGGLYPA